MTLTPQRWWQWWQLLLVMLGVRAPNVSTAAPSPAYVPAATESTPPPPLTSSDMPGREPWRRNAPCTINPVYPQEPPVRSLAITLRLTVDPSTDTVELITTALAPLAAQTVLNGGDAYLSFDHTDDPDDDSPAYNPDTDA
jgi:hypothetical protein